MRTYLHSLLHGGITALGFIYPYYTFLVYLGAGLELRRITELHASHIFVYFAVIHFLGSLWLQVPIHYIGHVPMPLTLLIIAIIALYCAALYAGTTYYLVRRPHTSNLVIAIQVASAISLAEWLKTHLVGGYPFILFAHAFVGTPFQSWIPLLGTLGSSWCLLFSITFLCQYPMPKHRWHCLYLLFVILGCSILVSQVRWSKAAQTIDAVLMHTHHPHLNVQPSTMPTVVLDKKSSPIDLVIWPEGIRSYMQQPTIKGLSPQTVIIEGVTQYDPTQQGYYNSMLGHNQDTTWTHHKHHLAQFNEWIPKGIQGLLALMQLPHHGFIPGDTSDAIWPMHQHTLGAIICYEMMFSDFVEFIANQSDFMVNINDLGWFSNSTFSQQFTHIARFMALLTSKPILMSSNVGASQAIDHLGHVHHIMDQHMQQYQRISITTQKLQLNWFSYRNQILLGIIICIYTLSYASQLQRRQKCFNLTR